jgi:hypothetical protein
MLCHAMHPMQIILERFIYATYMNFYVGEIFFIPILAESGCYTREL